MRVTSEALWQGQASREMGSNTCDSLAREVRLLVPVCRQKKQKDAAKGMLL